MANIKYKPEDILTVLDSVKPTNISYICRTIDCCYDVVKINLLQLERDGKARRLETNGLKETLWVSV